MDRRPRNAVAGLLMLVLGVVVVALTQTNNPSSATFELTAGEKDGGDETPPMVRRDRNLDENEGTTAPTTATESSTTAPTTVTESSTTGPSQAPPTWSPTRYQGPNPCEGKRPDLPNALCFVEGIPQTGEQAPANVTEGYLGLRDTLGVVPVTVPFWQVASCPVGVYWKLGAEHYSYGEYDETGTGPMEDASSDDVRQGYQCQHYDASDPKFTTEFDWQHCDGMTVGQTYEIQWPHSAAGACGTIWQYQHPFLDGVFCRDSVLVDTAAELGVQAQVFTVVNDDSYYYHDLMRGMIVDEYSDRGTDVAMYTGSYTLGGGLDNTVCSQFTPLTWHVDRKCHLISASSMDKLCEDMKRQSDDFITGVALSPQSARELVSDNLAANNQVSGGAGTAIGK
ncbi:expressed unknown protein [Seminavis robusta]|uniref:Uncharacterized protein n=1 Tax=Seminavis robusta TaxID=568900 RepID=A0A9N8HKX3_9STRA|nr:expressed unknown protein [Seminavis robusta]|eukprot:Sro766_g199350.1 n/a (395) ;mRNA; r:28878-30171